MYHASFKTQLPLEEVKRKLAPPHNNFPGWIKDETESPLTVTMYVRSSDILKRLFPDAHVHQANQFEGNSFIFNDDDMPLPAWFNTEGYKVVHVHTHRKVGPKDHFVRSYEVTPLNEIRI